MIDRSLATAGVIDLARATPSLFTDGDVLESTLKFAIFSMKMKKKRKKKKQQQQQKSETRINEDSAEKQI